MPVTEAREPANRIIDVEKEDWLSLNQARPWLPGRPSQPTVHRYCTTGIRGVVLETVRLSKARYTSKAAIQRFLDRLAAQDNED